MAGNTFGKTFRITTYGESHGDAIGVVIDGCPSGLLFDFSLLERDLRRRRPGQSSIVSRRDELDDAIVHSGVFEGRTTGTPICISIPNKDQKSKDYDALKDIFRPSHADYTYQQKYGIRDHRGGGRSSARETAARVAAGAVAKMVLKEVGTEIFSYVDRVGDIALPKGYAEYDLNSIETNEIRCPDETTAEAMINLIKATKKKGDTIGGTIFTVVKGCPIGLGEPVFDKLHSDLGKAVLSINACKGIEFGSGFDGTKMLGSVHNDQFELRDDKINTLSNNSGGIQGGISNGMDITFRAAFKPVATILQEQTTINTKFEKTTFHGVGRHDPCVLPRAVPIIESMTALVLVDHWLRHKAYHKY